MNERLPRSNERKQAEQRDLRGLAEIPGGLRRDQREKGDRRQAGLKQARAVAAPAPPRRETADAQDDAGDCCDGDGARQKQPAIAPDEKRREAEKESGRHEPQKPARGAEEYAEDMRGVEGFDARRREIGRQNRAVDRKRCYAEDDREADARRGKRRLRPDCDLRGEHNEKAQHRRGKRVEGLHHKGEREQRPEQHGPMARRPPGGEDANEDVKPCEIERERERVRPNRAARTGDDEPGAKPCRERHCQWSRHEEARRRMEENDRQRGERGGEDSLVERIAIVVEGDTVIDGNAKRGCQQRNRRTEEARPVGKERQQRIRGLRNAGRGARDEARNLSQHIEVGGARFAERPDAGLSCAPDDVRREIRRAYQEMIIVGQSHIFIGHYQRPHIEAAALHESVGNAQHVAAI